MTSLKISNLNAKILSFPFRILVKILSIAASWSTKGVFTILQIQSKLVKNTSFQLVPIDQLQGYTKIIEIPAAIETIMLPKIVGLSNGGTVSVNMPGDYLCKLDHVSFVPHSDFIRDENGYVANEKLFRKEYDILIPRDRDIIKIKGKTISLSKRKTKIYSKIAFNLMGTYSFQWAHFLAQYYPKLNFLSHLPKSEKIDLIIPKKTDLHIKYLIENELNTYPLINILEVDDESEIVCEKLYHVSLGTFLADDGYFPTPFSMLISNSTINFWDKKARELVPQNAKHYRRIFIGRKGLRSLNNYNEILDYFISLGFEEIFPHLLNIEDKIKIFSEAKYIVGPGSSGFTNSIFSQSGTKILAFMNSFRYLDTYLPVTSKYKKHEFWIMSGIDDNVNEMNSSYEIKLNDLKHFIEENDFLDSNV